MDLDDKIFIGILGILILCVVAFPFITWPSETYSGIVIGLYHGKLPYEHTTIEFATFSESTTSILVEGNHQVNIGHAYQITIRRYRLHWYDTLTDIEDLGPSALYTGDRTQ